MVVIKLGGYHSRQIDERSGPDGGCYRLSYPRGAMLEALGRLDILIVDELGYMLVDTNRGKLLLSGGIEKVLERINNLNYQ